MGNVGNVGPLGTLNMNIVLYRPNVSSFSMQHSFYYAWRQVYPHRQRIHNPFRLRLEVYKYSVYILRDFVQIYTAPCSLFHASYTIICIDIQRMFQHA